VSAVGTAVFVAVAVAATVAPDAVGGAAVAVDLALFALGVAVFLQAYAIAVQRSRYDAIGIGGLYFLAGAAPRSVRWRLNGLVVVQLSVALATALARPFSRLAFGVLVPMFGLGLAGLWGARYGQFPPRAPSSRPVGRAHGAGDAEPAGPGSATLGGPFGQNTDHG